MNVVAQSLEPVTNLLERAPEQQKLLAMLLEPTSLEVVDSLVVTLCRQRRARGPEGRRPTARFLERPS